MTAAGPHPSSPRPQDHRRAFWSFRRKSDFFWFLISFGMFCFALAVLLTRREPQVIETVRLVEKSPAKRRAPAPAAVPAAKPAAKAPAEPAPEPAGGAKVQEKVWQIFKDDGVVADAAWKDVGGENVLTIDYDFTQGRWVVVGNKAAPDFEKVRTIRFDMKGAGGQNTLEFKVEDAHGTNIGMRWHGVTDTKGAWRRFEISRSDLGYLWGGDGSELDWGNIKLVDFGVSAQETQGDAGGSGRVQIRRVQFL
jgi:hypothetical protein